MIAFSRTKLTIALAFGAAATACATAPAPRAPDGRPVPTTADLHRIKVAQIGESLDVPIADGVLNDRTLRAIADFASQYRLIGHGPLTVASPEGSNPQFAAAVRASLAQNGVLLEAIANSTYRPDSAEAPIRLGFSRFTAEAPTCPALYTENIADAHTNAALRSFGCATQANLAAMIADPADLVGPRPSEPADAARRTVVLDKYRSGEITHAVRSPDERVTVSQVANQ